jgi:hypothetical protein
MEQISEEIDGKQEKTGAKAPAQPVVLDHFRNRIKIPTEQ